MKQKFLKFLTVFFLIFGVSYISASRIVFKNKTNYYIKVAINITRLNGDLRDHVDNYPFRLNGWQEDKTDIFYINPMDMQKNRGEDEFNYDNYKPFEAAWQIMSLIVSHKKLGEQDYYDPIAYGFISDNEFNKVPGLKAFEYVKGDMPMGNWSYTSEQIKQLTERRKLLSFLGWAHTVHLDVVETKPGSGKIELQFKALFGVGD